MRAYTVQELDALRYVVGHKWLWGSYCSPTITEDRPVWARPYRGNELIVAVEELVRTHMLAGHTADDLRASESAEGERS
jgi:hypothetical protein